MSYNHHEYQRLLLKAKEKIEQYRSQLEKFKTTNDDIAIVGMACQFPGAGHYQQYWQNLMDGMVSTQPLITQDRWPYSELYSSTIGQKGKMYAQSAGLLASIDQFDTHLFKLSPREVEDMDPQQRLLLMVCWNLLEDANYAPLALPTQNIGVFIGVMNHDYANLLKDLTAINEYTGTGSTFSVAAGRISYIFGLTGPCVAIDTACASSLTAVHQACQSLKMGECELAIAGGVNLLLTPEAFVGSCQAHMISIAGECRPFDAKADGYVRAEGCGLILLKPLRQAQQAQDRIYAVIKGSALHHTGRSQGLTVPQATSQVMVMQNALANANIDPAQIDFLETHGTGTPLGDPIEAESIQMVYGQSRTKPLLLGAVKANIGHAESAAGIAGLIKIILALYHRCFPLQPAFEKLNPLCLFDSAGIEIPNALLTWEESTQILYGAVSAFSFSGTNVHMILQGAENIERETQCEIGYQENFPALLVFSTASVSSLQQLQKSYHDFLNHTSIPLAEICLASQLRQSNLPFRRAFLAKSKSELCQLLVNGDTAIVPISSLSGYDYDFNVILSDALPLIIAIHTTLLSIVTYQQFLQEVDQHFQKAKQFSFMPWLSDNNSLTQLSEKDAITLFIIIQNVCAMLWLHWGITPLKLWITNQYSLLSALVFNQVLPWYDLFSLKSLQPYSLNQQLSATLSHRWQHARYPIHIQAEEALSIQNIFELLENRHACSQLPEDKPSFVHFNLTHFQSKFNLLNALKDFYLLGCHVRWERVENRKLLSHCANLPAYPFDLNRYWIDDTRLRHYDAKPLNFQMKTSKIAQLGYQLDIPGRDVFFEQVICQDNMPLLSEHRIQNQILFPATAYLALSAALQKRYSPECHIESVHFLQPLVIEKPMSLLLNDMPSSHQIDHAFEFFAKPIDGHHSYVKYVTGKIVTSTETNEIVKVECSSYPSQPYSVPVFYDELRQRGLDYGPHFRRLSSIFYDEYSVVGQIEPINCTTGSDDYMPLAGMLDSGLQLIAILNKQNDLQAVYLPASLGKMKIFQPLDAIRKVRVTFEPNSQLDSSAPSFDICYLDLNDQLVLALYAFKVRALKNNEHADTHWFYEEVWQRVNSPLQQLTIHKIISDQVLLIAQLTEIQQSSQSQQWFNAIHDTLPQISLYVLQACQTITAHNGLNNERLKSIIQANLTNQQILTTLIHILQERNWIEKTGSDFFIIDNELPTVNQTDIEALAASIKLQYPQHVLETQLLFHCVIALPYILPGEKKYTDVLFTESSGLEGIYAESLGGNILNQQLAAAIKTSLSGLSKNTTITILEIGAGTGASTKAILNSLSDHKVHYIFSDVSSILVKQAQQQFASYKNLSFKVINANQDLISQGIQPNSIDIVVIANALHATSDVFQSLRHIQKALKISGILLLRELVKPAIWLDLIFGLTPEWWGAMDTLRSGNQPLLSISNWQAVLNHTGFANHELIADSNHIADMNEIIIIAKNEVNVVSIHEDCYILSEGSHPLLQEYITHLQQLPFTHSLSIDQLTTLNFDGTLNRIQLLYFLPAISTDTSLPDAHVEQLLKLCYELFKLIKQVVQSKQLLNRITITLIAYDCFDITPNDKATNFSLSVCEGFLKSLAHEHKDLQIRLLEVTANVTRDCFYNALWSISAPITSCRQKDIYVKKLKKFKKADSTSLKINYSTNGSYMIAGGLGGLGKAITQQLLSLGIKHLVLIGRTEVNEEIQHYCQALNLKYQAQVKYYSIDLSDPIQMQRLVQFMSPLPSVVGVIDAVGILQDGMLYHQPWHAYEAVLRTKIATAWYLHHYFGHAKEFILFSSAAALLGSPGQSNHSAANAYLDGLARYRRSQGDNAISINWGAWSEIGAAALKKVSEKLSKEDVGIGVIEPSQGQAAFMYIQENPTKQLAVIPVDWAKYSRYIPDNLRDYFSILFETMPTNTMLTQTSHASSTWKSALKTTLVSRRYRQCLDLLTDSLKAILHLDKGFCIDPNTHFFDLGMDSLLALQLIDILKIQFETNDIPTTLIFNYPNLSTLSRYLTENYIN